MRSAIGLRSLLISTAVVALVAATVIVEAFVAGESSHLDQVITQGGSTETPEPYSVNLNLSGAGQGQTVVLLVKGGVGLESDPGVFSAIPVVIG